MVKLNFYTKNYNIDFTFANLNEPGEEQTTNIDLTIDVDDGVFKYTKTMDHLWVSDLENPLLKTIFQSKPTLLIQSIKQNLQNYNENRIITGEKTLTMQFCTQIMANESALFKVVLKQLDMTEVEILNRKVAILEKQLMVFRNILSDNIPNFANEERKYDKRKNFKHEPEVETQYEGNAKFSQQPERSNQNEGHKQPQQHQQHQQPQQQQQKQQKQQKQQQQQHKKRQDDDEDDEEENQRQRQQKPKRNNKKKIQE